MNKTEQQTTWGTLENREGPLSGKTALITGSSRDIGAEIAKALVKEGVDIIGNYRDKPKKAWETERELFSLTGKVFWFIKADITNEEDRERLRRNAEKEFQGRLDILVLNASGPTREVNVGAANALVDKFLPIMPRGSKIVLMQSVPGHFEPQLENKIPEFYRPVAKAKYEGEQSLRARMGEFEDKGILFIVICPPEVHDTANIKVFARDDPQISEKNAEMSKALGLPTTITKKEVGEKVAEVLKRENLPQGYIEFFKE